MGWQIAFALALVIVGILGTYSIGLWEKLKMLEIEHDTREWQHIGQLWDKIAEFEARIRELERKC